MVFFDIFKKKKKEVKKELPKEYLQWNKMWDMWVEGKIETPYAELMDYSSGVNGEGHHCHFDNTRGNQDLKKYIDALLIILPDPLKSNVELAYETYMINPDDVGEENNNILENCDKVFYENEEKLNAILKERASKIDL